jgi:hypothetical protein
LEGDQADADATELPDVARRADVVAAETIDRPDEHDVEDGALRVEHEALVVVARLGRALDVDVLGNDLEAARSGEALKVGPLIRNRLLVGANAEVNRRACLGRGA